MLFLDSLSFVPPVFCYSPHLFRPLRIRLSVHRFPFVLKYNLVESRASAVLNTTGRYPLIVMVSPSSSLLDFSDNNEGEDEYQDHHGDYSARMDELFADQGEENEEGSSSHSPPSGDVEVTKATYRECLRDVLGSETTGEDDEADDLDRGNAFSDDEHPVQSVSNPQRPVSSTHLLTFKLTY